MKRERQKVYMIQSIGWYYNDEQDVPSDALLLRAFRTREAAEAHLRTLDAAASQVRPTEGENPFPGLLLASTDPVAAERELLAFLDRFGLPHPPPGSPVVVDHDWRDEFWWQEEILGQANQLPPPGAREFQGWFYGLFLNDANYEIVETYLE